MNAAYIIDAVRTPRGRGKPGKGALTGIHPQELLAQTLQQIATRTGVDPGQVEDVVIGCVSQAGEQGANVARNAVLASGWPLEIPAVSLNRSCASGLQAVNFAAVDGNNIRLREKHFQVPQGISADLMADTTT